MLLGRLVFAAEGPACTDLHASWTAAWMAAGVGERLQRGPAAVKLQLASPTAQLCS